MGHAEKHAEDPAQHQRPAAEPVAAEAAALPLSAGARGERLQAQHDRVETIRRSPAMVAQRQRVAALGAPQPRRANALPAGLAAGIESLSGLAMDHVAVHYDSPEPARLDAQAYARGSDIHLGPGQEGHLPHEAWHVVQQAQGRVAPTLQAADGSAVNDDPALEREADAMGARALAAQAPAQRAAAPAPRPGGVVQRETSYASLVPKHEMYGEKYELGDQSKSDKFTYHHIIPENKLIKVRQNLEKIDKAAAAPNIDKSELDEEKEGLIETAAAGWKVTRVKDTTYEINHQFADFGVVVTQAEVSALLDKYDETADNLQGLLFPDFVILLKGKIRTQFAGMARSYRQTVDATIENRLVELRKSPDTLLDRLLEAADPGIFFDRATLRRTIAGKVQYRMHANIKAPTVRKYLEPALADALDFDAFFQDRCASIHADTRGAKDDLSKIVKEDALPHEQKKHLEHAVQWNPGNVHRGPSPRIGPDSGDFQALFDDGGKAFETAAVNLLDSDHFELLTQLNAAIDTFIAPGNSPPTKPVDQAMINAARGIVAQMREVQTYGLTAYAAQNWAPLGQDKMRLVAHDERIAEAQQRELIE